MRIHSILLLLLIAPIALFAQEDFSSTFRKINQEVKQHTQAYHHLEQATQRIGHRLTGSANGAKAEELAFSLLKSYGFRVKYQSFEAQSWERRSLALTVGSNADNTRAIKAVSLAHSPVSAQLSAALIDVGNGLDTDYASLGERVKGKMALVYLGVLPGSAKGTSNLHRSEKTALAVKHGAVGVIFINTVEGGVLLTGTASVDGKLIAVPALCIGLEDGWELKKRLVNENLVANVDMQNFSSLIKARNIIATWPGSTLPNEKIVVGAHLDSWDLATGAIDNGIGSFSVIDMARTFARLQLKTRRNIEFVLFMGEEQGLLGSKAYVE